MILMRENPFWGPLEGVGPENRDFLGSWNGNERRLLSGGQLPFYRGLLPFYRGQMPFYRGHNLISSLHAAVGFFPEGKTFSLRKPKKYIFLSVGQSLFFFKENCNFHTPYTVSVHLGIVSFVKSETIWLFATPRHTAHCIWWWNSLACHLYLSPDAPLLIPTVQLGNYKEYRSRIIIYIIHYYILYMSELYSCMFYLQKFYPALHFITLGIVVTQTNVL